MKKIEAATDEMVRREPMDTDVPSPRNIALASLPQMIDFSFNTFRYMHKCIVKSDAQDFVTSDAPVVWVDPAQFPEPRWKFYRLSGFMEVTLPLSRRYCLVMAWHPMLDRSIGDEAMVGTINARTSTHYPKIPHAIYSASRNWASSGTKHETTTRSSRHDSKRPPSFS